MEQHIPSFINNALDYFGDSRWSKSKQFDNRENPPQLRQERVQLLTIKVVVCDFLKCVI